jgi:transcriptional regulator with XRE-family HTH domain
MIKNERQYRISAAEAQRFENALAIRPPAPPAGSEIHPRLWQAERDALLAQAEELRRDITAYEALRSGQRRVFGVSHLSEVPRALIEARIATGLTQKDLAVRLKLPEQTIQRYESTDYASASLERLQEVAAAVGVKVAGLVALPDQEPSSKRFFERLKQIGLRRQFVLNRLLAPRIAMVLEAPKRHKELVFGALIQAAETINRIFDISPAILFSDATLTLDPTRAGGARFKKPNRAVSDSSRLAFGGYTMFAHYLALLTLHATAELSRPILPKGSAEWRAGLLARYGSLTFENVVRFFWDLGIPVLPLRDEGAFHGACWRTGWRNVIVLKQRSLSQDRWVFDVLHEGGHIDDEPDSESFSVIEDEIPLIGDPSEQRATQFAADIVLSGNADKLATRAVEIARGKIQRLEAAAREVARDAGVSVGALANYLAFRIAEDTADGERINWWGTASRLQEQTDDPWRIARDIFLEHADLGRLSGPDRDLLMRSLTDSGREASADNGS